MSSPDANKFLVRSEVKHAYTINAKADYIFEYLSDIKMLLVNIPNISRIQVRKNSGQARLFCSMPVLAFKMNVVVDVEIRIDSANRTISFFKPTALIDALPHGYIVGTFGANIDIMPKENGDTRIISQVNLGFDSSQIDMFKLLPPIILESAGQRMLQEFVDQTSKNYVSKLVNDFPIWLRQKQQT
ncbi:DUF1997 domain-containing protein [Candidatus Chlorohelix sp.]|uniref:DUF1997 domain-containing protein n=1 Tax=Candidatus Chlorohelix sp. TaxID=3139201 RepID=UPI00303FAE27